MINEHYSHNMAVINTNLQDYIERVINVQIRKMCDDIANKFVHYINESYAPLEPRGGNEDYPVWTLNMRDSTGIGVYNNGRLTSYIPYALATEPQRSGFRGNIRNIWGTSYLQRALTDSAKYNKGIWIVLFCAVPYAIDINNYGSKWGRGVNFFEKFTDTFRKTVEERVNTLQWALQ